MRLLSVMCVVDIILLKIKALFQHTLAAEKYHACRAFVREAAQLLILVIEDTGILLCLVLRDALFCLNIALHRVMAVQMIRRDI